MTIAGRTLVLVVAFHDFAIDVCLQALLQRALPLDVALDCRERLKPLRNVLTFLRADLLNQLAAVEGTKAILLVACQKLSLPSVEQQIVELIDIHLDTDINLCVLVCFDASNAIFGAYETPDTILHEGKQFLSVEQQTLGIVTVPECGAEHESAKVNVHE
jgi:hypothetical protein